MVRQSSHESGNAVIWSSDGLSNPNRAEVAAYRIMDPLRPVRYCTDDPAILTRQSINTR